jgi:hypothetical protein
VANGRPKRVLGCAPSERIGADRAAMLALPPVPPQTGWRAGTRLPRDHYVRVDGNDYSVHPASIGRRVEVVADLHRVRVLSEGRLVADHPRSWAKHQAFTDPEHARAAAVLRREHRAPDRRPGLLPGAGRAAATGQLRRRPRPPRRARGGPAGSGPDHARVAGGPVTGRAVGGTAAHSTSTNSRSARDVAAEVAFLTRALKAPTLR